MGLAGRVREVNNTFYRLPEARTFASWAARAPAGFVFAVKASRFLTHMPVLYQLPPGWKLDLTRLEHFVQALPRRALHVLEFRDPSWHTEDVLKLLGRHRVALCLHDMRGEAPGRQRA